MTVPPNFDDTDEVQRSFTSWKMDLAFAMAIDPRLRPSDFRVGFAILQHLNGETRRCFPSHETIATLLNLSLRTVELCTANLHRCGWLRWTRGNQLMPNSYEWLDHNVSYMLDRLVGLRDTMREDRQERRIRHELRVKDDATRKSLRVPTGNSLRVSARQELRDNTSGEHLKNNTLGVGIDSSDIREAG